MAIHEGSTRLILNPEEIALSVYSKGQGNINKEYPRTLQLLVESVRVIQGDVINSAITPNIPYIVNQFINPSYLTRESAIDNLQAAFIIFTDRVRDATATEQASPKGLRDNRLQSNNDLLATQLEILNILLDSGEDTFNKIIDIIPGSKFNLLRFLDSNITTDTVLSEKLRIQFEELKKIQVIAKLIQKDTNTTTSLSGGRRRQNGEHLERAS